MSKGKLVLGALAGLAIGAIAGILFAPDKGSKTRKQIMDKGDDYLDKLKSKFDEFYGSLADSVDGVKKDGQDLADKGKSKYDDVKKDVKNTATDFKHAVS